MTTAELTSGAASWIHWLEAVSGAPTAATVQSALAAVDREKDTLAARLAFGKLSLHVRPIPLETGESEHGQLKPVHSWIEVPEYFTQDIAARLTFLVGLSELLAPAELRDVVTTLYRTGSDREQISVLRALPFLPGGQSLVELAREASRTNDVAVFSALACDSTYPTRHLPDPAFEQLVLKALFMGVPLTRIVHVESRVTAELQRMIGDFADERRAAGRAVPSDVPWLLSLSPQAAKPV